MITFASRVFRIIIQPFKSCLLLDAVSWGCAHPAVRLCLPYATATRPVSPWARLGLLLCDGIDSWIRYVVVITLASRVFEYFLRLLLLACVSYAFLLRWGCPLCATPCFLAYPHVFLTCGPFTGFLGFIWRLSLLQLCWRRSPHRLPRLFFC